MAKQFLMGVDIGGTKIAATVLDADSKAALATEKVATPQSYEELIAILTGLVARMEQKLQASVTYGMCYPGSTDAATGLTQNANMPWLNGRPFESDLREALKRDIRTDNDANCFALSEAIDGAAQNGRVVFGATLGTGLGGGIVMDKKIWRGLNRLGGEWGHVPLPWPHDNEIPGPPCYCGLKGCLESYLSGTGLARSFQHDTGKTLKSEEIVRLANDHCADAEGALTRFENRLARALAMIINVIDPDIIVLGGGLSSLQRLYTHVPTIWNDFVFCPHPIKTPLVPAKFGGESGMRGAAWLWHEDLLN